MDGKEEEKYLMFLLDDEYYGIPILKVNEIIGLMGITHIPGTPEFMKGIINLRGKIIPIMDLRLKFGMPKTVYNEQTCIIIVEIPLHGQTHFIGTIVDKVSEVVNIYQVDIESPPEYGQKGETDFLTGIGKVKGKVVMLLDIEMIVNCQEVLSLIATGAEKDIEKDVNKDFDKTKKVEVI